MIFIQIFMVPIVFSPGQTNLKIDLVKTKGKAPWLRKRSKRPSLKTEGKIKWNEGPRDARLILQNLHERQKRKIMKNFQFYIREHLKLTI